MLNVESVKAKNFLSYDKAELVLNRKEPTLVIGQNKSTSGAVSNGSGKTALFEAVLYGLFGRTTSGRHGDNCVKAFATDCVVEVKGTSNNIPFTITRYRKHSIHKNKTNFTYNGKPVEGGSKKDTQELIEDTLNINFDLILQTCYFSPSSIQTFCGMTDSDQKGIFQALLDLDKWEIALERVKAQEAVLSQKKTKAKAELTLLQQLKNRDMQELLRILKEVKDVDTTQQEAELKAGKEFLELHKGTDDTIRKIKAILADCSKNEADHSRILGGKLASIKDKTQLLNGTCPTCSSPIEPATIQAEIDSLQLEVEQIYAKLEETKVLAKKASSRLDVLNKTKADMVRVTGNIKVLETFLFSKLELKSEKLTRKEQVRGSIINTSNQIKELRKLLEFIKSKELLYKQLITIFGTTGARTYLMKQVLPHLNRSIATYRAILCPAIDVRLEAQKTMTTKQVKNKFDVRVISPIGGGYKSLSSGEAKRVDLCIVFGFLDLIRYLGKQTNFLILDEILDNLDQAGEDAAINQLKQLDQPNIFLISHKNSLSARFSNVLLIEKDNNTSKIVLDG